MTLTFKTNINCAGCIAKITPALRNIPAIEKWNVDTAHPDKILSIETEQLSASEIENIITGAGFKASALNTQN